MGNLTPRPAPQAKPRPLTDEEKKTKIMQFLQQKREAFAINILANIAKNIEGDTPPEICLHMVDTSVEMADRLMEKLYPLPDNDLQGKEGEEE